MVSYYCTNDYNKLSESFYNRLSEENSTFTVDSAIKELDVFVNGYKQEKKRYDWWMSRPRIENPKNSKEHWYNCFWDEEHSDKSMYRSNMKKQQDQFTAMENAILRWLPVSPLTGKERDKVIKKIMNRRQKMCYGEQI